MKGIAITESPYSAPNPLKRLLHICYAREAQHEVFERGYIPFSSHLSFTQSGVLDDLIQEERNRGIQAGFEVGKRFDVATFFTDYGLSRGMKHGLDTALENKKPIYEVKLGNWWPAFKIRVEHHSDAALWGLPEQRISELEKLYENITREEEFLISTQAPYQATHIHAPKQKIAFQQRINNLTNKK